MNIVGRQTEDNIALFQKVYVALDRGFVYSDKVGQFVVGNLAANP